MDSLTELHVEGFRMWSAQERSDHTAVFDDGFLYVWGGFRSSAGEEVFLPSDEICRYDMRSGIWETLMMTGDTPPSLSRACGCYLNGVMYVFGGCDNNGHSNQLYSVNLRDEEYTWKKMTDSKGSIPSPRDKHSCWMYRDRLIYFGGYGCKQIREVNHSSSFTIDEASWAMIGNALFRFWGWNNEVHIYDPTADAWSEPQTHGLPPAPTAAHASATIGNKGYVCGGTVTMTVDIHCLDLDSWAWTQIVSSSAVPKGRSWHTLTAVSDTTLFLFGGLSMSCEPLSDGWIFDLKAKEWRQLEHSHKEKPRLWHSACLGKDSDVIVFGGSPDYNLLMDTISILRSPSQGHCSDVLVFQTRPYSLLRLCEDCIGKNASILREQLSWLPPKLQKTIQKRIVFFGTLENSQGKGISA